jgi:membrane protease YdiL (CAAX protease family)
MVEAASKVVHSSRGGTSAAPVPSPSVIAYFGLVFLASWAWWIAAASLIPTAGPSVGAGLLFLPGTLAPGIVALWVTSRAEGRSGLRALLGRLLQWRVGLHWYLFALTLMAVARLSAAAAHRLILGTWPTFAPVPWFLLLLAAAISTPFQAGEEIGWRGFALPRLAARLGLARASVLLGVVWAAWHLPLFYLRGTDSTGQPFVPYLLAVTALSVAFAALYWRSRGSLLLTMILHAAINNTSGIVPSRLPGASDPLALEATPMAWLTAASLWVVAGGLLTWMARARVKSLPDPVVGGRLD